MIRLDTTTRKLQAVLAGAITTNQLACTVCYSDDNGTTYVGGTQLTNTNSTTAVDICAAPGASTVRDIDYLSIRNRDTAAATVTVMLDDNGTDYEIVKATLAVGDQLVYTHGDGWRVIDTDGNLKTGGSGAGAVTSSGLTMATSRLLGRTTASSGAIEEISVGSGLSLSAGSLSASLTDGAWTDYSATSTIVGWSSFTTKQIYYKDIGKTRFVTFMLYGTSNSASVTFTLPSASSNDVQVWSANRVINNGSEGSTGMCNISANSSTLTCYTAVLGAWVASGTKLAAGQFTYQLP